MSIEQNKATIHRFLEAQKQGDIEAMLSFWSTTPTNHGEPVSLDVMRMIFTALQTAFPDRQWEVKEMIGEGDLIALRLKVSGTHQGAPAIGIEAGPLLQQIVPTGRAYSIDHMHFFRMADDKIAEHWAVRDDLGLLEQLGGLPE